MGAISEAAKTFLARRVVIDHEIVTYRVLSRELSVHVNEAKKWLEEFLEQSKQSDAPVHATYVLSGAALPSPAIDLTVDVESEGEKEFGDSQACSSSSAVPSVPTWQILLTPAEDLEQCKGRFVRISSIHVYSLSPARLKDPALLVTTTTIVRQRDSSASNLLEHAKVVGMTLNPNWLPSVPSTRKVATKREMPVSEAELKPAVKVKIKPEPKAETAKPPKPKPKPADKPVAKRPATPAEKPVSKAPSKTLDFSNRTSTARLKKRVLISDTEDEEDTASRPASVAPATKKPRKSEREQSPASESEPEHVPLSAAEARRKLKVPKKEKEMDIDTLAKKEGRERKKTAKRGGIPKGKRRVQKERTFVNERGRTVTEDYWTLESASDDADEGVGTDNDSPPAKKSRDELGSRKMTTAPKAKTKAKARASSARDTDVEEGPPTTKRKSEVGSVAKAKSKDVTKDVEKTAPRGSTKPLPKSTPALKEKKSGQKTLASFFKK